MNNTMRPIKLAKVTGIYRWTEGTHFDHKYYGFEHAELTKELLVPHGLLRFESDQAVGVKVQELGSVVAISNAYFSSLVEVQAALSKAGPALAADLPNYTNIRPELHISEVLVHER